MKKIFVLVCLFLSFSCARVVDDVDADSPENLDVESSPQDQRACEYARNVNNIEVWRFYLKEFPNGLCVSEAKKAIVFAEKEKSLKAPEETIKKEAPIKLDSQNETSLKDEENNSPLDDTDRVSVVELEHSYGIYLLVAVAILLGVIIALIIAIMNKRLEKLVENKLWRLEELEGLDDKFRRRLREEWRYEWRYELDKLNKKIMLLCCNPGLAEDLVDESDILAASKFYKEVGQEGFSALYGFYKTVKANKSIKLIQILNVEFNEFYKENKNRDFQQIWELYQFQKGVSKYQNLEWDELSKLHDFVVDYDVKKYVDPKDIKLVYDFSKEIKDTKKSVEFYNLYKDLISKRSDIKLGDILNKKFYDFHNLILEKNLSQKDVLNKEFYDFYRNCINLDKKDEELKIY